MDVYPGRLFYVTNANFGTVDVHLPEHQKVGEVAQTAKEIIHIKNERFSYRSGTYANNSNFSAYALQYKPAPDQLH